MSTNYLVRRSPATLAGLVPTMAGSPRFGPQTEGAPYGYTPSDIRAAYDLPSSGGTGAIAIVDAFNLSTLQADFNTFAKQYGLPQETSKTITSMSNSVLTVVYPTGKASPNDDKGWGGEIALDMEWAHAIAPGCKIYLVLAASNANADLFSAVQTASTLPGVKEVSMSWGGPEDPTETQYDTDFQTSGIVYFASAGDFGGFQQYPSESPYVVGIGGTSLVLSNNKYLNETAWSGSGGGPSSYEPRPTWQTVVQGIVGQFRGTPDEAAIADPYTGVWVFSTGALGGWSPGVGGTSLACPVTAAITNLRGTWTHSTTREEERIYFNLGGPYYHDITSGTAGTFTAQKGWDFITGIGSPTGLFPPYTPPENRLASLCQVYQYGHANLANTQQSQILAAIANLDGTLYSVGSVSTSLGQTTAEQMNFTMDKPLALLSQADVKIDGEAPSGTTIEVFAKVQNPASPYYGRLIYSGFSAPGTGGYTTLSFQLNSNFVNSATGGVTVVIETIRPAHISTLPYTYNIDQVQLAEVTVPAWDVNLPL